MIEYGQRMAGGRTFARSSAKNQRHQSFATMASQRVEC